MREAGTLARLINDPGSCLLLLWFFWLDKGHFTQVLTSAIIPFSLSLDKTHLNPKAIGPLNWT